VVKRVIQGAVCAATLTASSLLAWQCLPYWLSPVAALWLPAEHVLSISAPAHLVFTGLQVPSFQYRIANCLLLEGHNALLSHRQQWALHIDSLVVNPDCVTSQADKPQTPLPLHQVQQWLSLTSLSVDQLTLTPWKNYSGQLDLHRDPQGHRLALTGSDLQLDIGLSDEGVLQIKRLQLRLPDSAQPWQLSGQVQLANTLNLLPRHGELMVLPPEDLTPSPWQLQLSWHDSAGLLQVNQRQSPHPLLSLPWHWQDNALQIKEGQWQWPYLGESLHGGLSFTLSHWDKQLTELQVQGQLNLITHGVKGEANLLLNVGPGKLARQGGALPLQLKGQLNQDKLSFDVSLPAMLSGSFSAPQMVLGAGAWLRASGELLDNFHLLELKVPLAGVRLDRQGVSGPLQMHVRGQDSHWGEGELHLDGLAEQFGWQGGQWHFNYWGKGQLPALAANWDLAGKGYWQDNRLTLDSLSSGFDRLHYQQLNVQSPRLTLTKPLVWQRQSVSSPGDDFSASLQLAAQHVNFSYGGYLPVTTLQLQLTGRSPEHFQVNGILSADPVGPIQLAARWDGKQLRGRALWPKQSLPVFQSLVDPQLDLHLREGIFHAQTDFSITRRQGVSAAGVFVVENAGLWLRDSSLSGLDFSLPYRFSQDSWQFGSKQPVQLHLNSWDNQFQLANVHAELRGSYPWRESAPLVLDNVEANMLRGRVSLSQLRLPQHQPALLQLRHIDLGDLMNAIQVRQVVMTGSVSGELPLSFGQPDWLVRNGKLTNDGALSLRLDPQLVDAMTQSNISNRLALEWLRYMQINRSRSQLDLSAAGELNLQARVDGDSPHQQQHRRVILNYTHQENIFQLWRSLRYGDHLQSWLQQSLSYPVVPSQQKNSTSLSSLDKK